MEKYRVTILRTFKGEDFFKDDSGDRYNFTNIEPFMTHTGFKNLSQSSKKKVVKGFLNKVPRSEIKADTEIEKKERVIVNEKGDYGLDRTHFDSKVRIPDHLLADKHKKKARQGSRG